MPKSLVGQYSKEELTEIVSNNYSYREVLLQIGYQCVTGRQYNVLKNKIKEYNIDISHFTTIIPKERTDNDIFIQNSEVTQSVLRRRYIKNNYTKYKCSICGQLPIWNDSPLTLTLDHINGDNTDNRLENLRWVCPNCDRQLNTFAGRNSKVLERKKKYCKICGKEISLNGYLCKECSANKARKTHRPIREELKDLIRNKSFTEIGSLYQVSDNTIKKWCDSYNLPRLKSDISKFSDDEWDKI